MLNAQNQAASSAVSSTEAQPPVPPEAAPGAPGTPADAAAPVPPAGARIEVAEPPAPATAPEEGDEPSIPVRALQRRLEQNRRAYVRSLGFDSEEALRARLGEAEQAEQAREEQRLAQMSALEIAQEHIAVLEDQLNEAISEVEKLESLQRDAETDEELFALAAQVVPEDAVEPLLDILKSRIQRLTPEESAELTNEDLSEWMHTYVEEHPRFVLNLGGGAAATTQAQEAPAPAAAPVVQRVPASVGATDVQPPPQNGAGSGIVQHQQSQRLGDQSVEAANAALAKRGLSFRFSSRGGNPNR
jgi:hypothetical protein